MDKAVLTLIAIAGFALIGISQSVFIVDQRTQAIVLQLGDPVGDPADRSSYIKGPGLHFKLPFVQNVQYFDRRILSVDPGPEQVVVSSVSQKITPPAPVPDTPITTDPATPVKKEDGPVIESVSGEPIIVDTFARYKIVDPLQFLETLRTITNASSRLENILNDATRTVLGKSSLKDLLSVQRTKVMADIRSRLNTKIEQDKLGIQIVDVRIIRADLTQDLLSSTVRRMISELKARATETRAKGEERALEIRSTADKERTVLIAEAERDSQVLRGEGDKEAIKIYAEAFNKDKEFYGFIRSMEAYRNTLADPDTRLILSPDSEFFRYFQAPGGR
jgi:membrane protease subunit HflC